MKTIEIKNQVKSEAEIKELIKNISKKYKLINNEGKELNTNELLESFKELINNTEKEKILNIVGRKLSIVEELSNMNVEVLKINENLNKINYKASNDKPKEIENILEKNNSALKAIEKEMYKKENLYLNTKNLINYNTTDEGFFFIEELAEAI